MPPSGAFVWAMVDVKKGWSGFSFWKDSRVKFEYSVTSESLKLKHKEKENDFFIPKPVSKKKMTVGRERFYILQKRKNLMTKVKSLNSENYVNFQVSVFCVFFIKDKEGNYLDHEEIGLKSENEEIYKIFSDSYDKKKA